MIVSELISYCSETVREIMQIQIVEAIPSTNSYLMEHGAELPSGTVLITNCQTAGRGTHGRSFYSVGNGGIYCSILFRPKMTPTEALQITTQAGILLQSAITDVTGIETRIKPINDIYLGEKKICGILTESKLTPKSEIDYTVLGFGLNVCPSEEGFPEEIRKIAGTLVDCYDEKLKYQLTAKILENLCGFL